MKYSTIAKLSALVFAALGAMGPICGGGPGDPPPLRTYPQMLVRPEHKEVILSRLDREPYATIYAEVAEQAAREYEPDDPEHWDPHINGRNGETAEANAFLAWLHDDETPALKARDFFGRLEDDWNSFSSDNWDINIRMPRPLMCYTNAWDLLKATPWFPDDEAEAARDKLTTITTQFFAHYLEDEFFRLLMLDPAQNNHPIRTASAIGYVALAFPDHPDALTWADWALSELSYLWGPNGQYVQPDGGVSEGPFYYGFAWGVSTAIFIALDNLYPSQPRTYTTDCRNRSDQDPWTGHGCVDGEIATFANPLHSPLYHATVDWSLSLRLPFGARAPLEDANWNAFNGGALLSSFGGDGRYRWDWENNTYDAYAMTHGYNLRIHHLVYFDDSVVATEPPWTSRFLYDAGNAIFRSDWSDDARWGLLVAEHGSVRKTLHDHMDGTSFTLAAYGEYLLLDSGYYKPNYLQNAVTAYAPSHNVILIEGGTTPEKGLLTDFGDDDAFLENIVDGEIVEYAEAHQDYRETHVERSAVFVDGRYFILADRLTTDATGPRLHQWRMHGYAGFTSGGTFTVRSDGARWERPLAGVDVFVSSTATPMAVVEPPWVENEAPHVHQFNGSRDVEDHGVIDASVIAEAPWFLSVLAPYRVGATDPLEEPLAVAPVELGDGLLAWTIQYGTAVDLVLLREPWAAETIPLPGGRVLATDGELVVVRLAGPSPFALLARGTHVTLDGETLATLSGDDQVALEESSD